MRDGVGRGLRQMLQRLFSRETVSDDSRPTLQEIESRRDDLDVLNEQLATSIEALQTKFQALIEEAATDENDDQAVRRDLTRVLLTYRSYRKQRRYSRLADNYYRKAGYLLREEPGEAEEVALVERLVTQAQEWDRKRKAMGARPRDVPHRWETTYHFSTSATGSHRDQRRATRRADSLVETARKGHDVSSLEDIVLDLFGDEMPSIDREALLQTDAVQFGDCPSCGTALFSTDVLVEYETTDRESAAWAVCPACGEPVRPEETTTETAVQSR